MSRPGDRWSDPDIVDRLRDRTENIDAIFEAANEIEHLRSALQIAIIGLIDAERRLQGAGMLGGPTDPVYAAIQKLCELQAP